MFKLPKTLNEIILLEQAIAINGEYNFKNDNEYLESVEKIFAEDFQKKSIKYDLFEGYFKDKYVKLNIRKYDMQFYIFNDNEFIGLVGTYNHSYSVLFKHFIKYHKYILPIKCLNMEDEYKNKGIMKFVIQNLLDAGYSLLTDQVEYEHVRRLWKSLSKLDQYQLDLLDLKNNVISLPDIKIEDINDPRVWDLLDGLKSLKLKLNRIKYDHYMKKEIYRRLIIYNKEKHKPVNIIK